MTVFVRYWAYIIRFLPNKLEWAKNLRNSKEGSSRFQHFLYKSRSSISVVPTFDLINFQTILQNWCVTTLRNKEKLNNTRKISEHGGKVFLEVASILRGIPWRILILTFFFSRWQHYSALGQKHSFVISSLFRLQFNCSNHLPMSSTVCKQVENSTSKEPNESLSL